MDSPVRSEDGPQEDGGQVNADDMMTQSLEKQKFRLLQQIARDKKVKFELESKLKTAESKALEKKQRLGEYNALFMMMGDNANEKAPRQKLGAREAVLGTKRIIERELNKLSKEAAVTEMKLNKAKDKNIHLRAQMDSLRKEHMTFKKLFTAMSEELGNIKTRIGSTRRAIDDGYSARDRAQEDMRELAKQFELDKLERQQEWQLFSEAIDKANLEGLPETLESGTGLLTQEEEEALRKKIKRGQMKMAKDRAVLQMAEAKLKAFTEALQQIRTSTGYDDLQDIIDLFNKYEDEKFNKVGAANRMVVEIERLEKDVAEMRTEVKAREAENATVKAARTHQLTSLESQASVMESQVIETGTQAKRMLDEVKIMYPVIDYAFYAIGCDKAFEIPSGNPGSPIRQRSASPLRSKTASLQMYTQNKAMTQDVQAGVTASTLSQFMGIIENRSADIIQQYVATVSAGTDVRAISRTASPAPEAGSSSISPGATARGPMSPAALGPSRPTGRLKESLTSSALVAALAVDASKLDGPEGDDEDSVRPISLMDLKRQAASQMNSDKAIKAVRSAAANAATVLTRGGFI